MSDEYDDDAASEQRAGAQRGRPTRPKDPKIDEAKQAVMEFFPDGGTDVFYGRQIEILLEKRFFHWITQRALNALVAERQIGFEEASSGPRVAHFYYPRRHRYARRQIKEIIGLIDEFSEPVFTRALGHHGETLLDVGLAYSGFRIRQKNVKAVDGIEWTESNHDLDRLIERDGVRYGVEIKNTLGYIDQTEYHRLHRPD